mmetsp:Transcript_44061/g.95757  ORF Transcript_44061/g.95757 Transcript_44061/m.95757 type:complete len:116 (+) Transcript_44061:208-555(+)
MYQQHGLGMVPCPFLPGEEVLTFGTVKAGRGPTAGSCKGVDGLCSLCEDPDLWLAYALCPICRQVLSAYALCPCFPCFNFYARYRRANIPWTGTVHSCRKLPALQAVGAIFGDLP